MSLLTYVLNLPSDTERLRAIQEQARRHPFLDLLIVPTIDGRLLPHSACFPLTRNKWSVNYKGTLACFLAHVRAWEMIAESRCDYSLIVEDDISLHNVDLLDELRLPAGVELAFCNDRTCYDQLAGRGPTFLQSAPALSFVAKHGQAIGADGYLLTPAGARRLLSFVQADGFFSHVDLRLFAYGLRRGSIFGIGLAAHSIVNNIGLIRQSYDAEHYIETRVLSPYIVKHNGGQGSRRAAADIQFLFGDD